MPTFTTIALETLLEPRIGDSCKDSLKEQTTKSVHNNGDGKKAEEKNPKLPNHIYISPALYITPEPTPIPASASGSVSPSPYVFNRKGRGGKFVNHRIDGFEIQNDESNSNGGEDDSRCQLKVEEMVDDKFLGEEIVGDGNEDSLVDDDFFDPRCESSSVASSSELNDFGRQVENLSVASNQGDFFDANEEFSSPCGQSIESELRATRLSLLEEIERRKTAEDAVGLMHSQWQRVGNLLLSQAGLTFPTPSNASSSIQFEINSIERFCQEVVIARFVAETIGKGQARAEAELAAEVIIESKDQEISRLRDRLQYYEAVNHEMSQRNQEVMEVTRRQRHRKKAQRRWLWGCIGLSITIGASVIAYTCLPQTGKHHFLPTSSDPPDASSVASSESA